MKALGTEHIPSDEPWLCEIKYDGYRAVAVLHGGRVELWSRTRKSMTGDYPEIVTELARLKCNSAVLDGEIVALDAKGRSRFQLLQGRDLAGGQRPVIAYYVFDLMQHDGRDLCARPIEERKATLAALKAQVEAGGGTMASIVKVNTYVTDMRYRPEYARIRGEFFGPKMPASTMVAVSALAAPEFLIEIEAVAVI